MPSRRNTSAGRPRSSALNTATRAVNRSPCGSGWPTGSRTQRLIDPRCLPGEVVAFGEVGGGPGGIGIQPCRGQNVARFLVEVRRGGGVAGGGRGQLAG